MDRFKARMNRITEPVYDPSRWREYEEAADTDPDLKGLLGQRAEIVYHQGQGSAHPHDETEKKKIEKQIAAAHRRWRNEQK